MPTGTANLVPRDVALLYGEALWAPAHSMLLERLAREPDPLEGARLKLALVSGYNDEDWTRGLRDPARKTRILDDVDRQISDADVHLRASAAFQRGMALHIEFVMAEGDLDRELACFTAAADLYAAAGDREGAALATAMIGIFHHVDRLDRETAVGFLRTAYDMAPAGASFARSEAARHLGQIEQERGDPAGALPLLEESLRLRRALGEPRREAAALHALGYALLEAGCVDAAERTLQEARANGERHGAAFMLALIARTEADLALARMLGPGQWRRSHP